MVGIEMGPTSSAESGRNASRFSSASMPPAGVGSEDHRAHFDAHILHGDGFRGHLFRGHLLRGHLLRGDLLNGDVVHDELRRGQLHLCTFVDGERFLRPLRNGDLVEDGLFHRSSDGLVDRVEVEWAQAIREETRHQRLGVVGGLRGGSRQHIGERGDLHRFDRCQRGQPRLAFEARPRRRRRGRVARLLDVGSRQRLRGADDVLPCQFTKLRHMHRHHARVAMEQRQIQSQAEVVDREARPRVSTGGRVVLRTDGAGGRVRLFDCHAGGIGAPDSILERARTNQSSVGASTARRCNSLTTLASASVVVSPRLRPSATSRSRRRMILPLRVLGRSGVK